MTSEDPWSINRQLTCLTGLLFDIVRIIIDNQFRIIVICNKHEPWIHTMFQFCITHQQIHTSPNIEAVHFAASILGPGTTVYGLKLESCGRIEDRH